MIKVTKKDDVHILVDTDESISQEICDYFTFEIPGAKFMPLYRKRLWDGKARLFNIYKKETNKKINKIQITIIHTSN